MRYILVIAILTLSGCAVINDMAPICPGTRYYDPQICRGEYFQQLPNFENEALIRRSRGEVW